MDSCHGEHQRCRAKSVFYLPRRVLKIRPGNSSPDIALIETESQPNGRYACLSYCWGPYQPLRTLKGNLEDMKGGISWSSLPRSFQDAVFVARELDMDYLWIDSLCIIQDDVEDWAAESAAMADVFNNAYVTISANVAGSCDAGFLRELQFTEFKEIHGQGHDGTRLNVYVRRSQPHQDFNRYFPKKVENNPLGTRAWALQEYLLSPRSLQFGPSEMVWECNTSTHCECEAFPYDSAKQGFLPALNQLSSDQVLMQWLGIVDEYMCRNLTFESDRFVALSGIAKLVQSVLQCEYYAGLWQSGFVGGLAWYTRNTEQQKRPEKYQPPTWSWASVQIFDPSPTPIPAITHIERYFGVIEPDATAAYVVDVSCTAASGDPTGAVSDGSVKLSSIIPKAASVVLHYTRIPSYYIELLGCKTTRFYPDVTDECVLEETYYGLVLGWSKFKLSIYISILICKPASPQDQRLVRVGFAMIEPKRQDSDRYKDLLFKIEPAARRCSEII